MYSAKLNVLCMTEAKSVPKYCQLPARRIIALAGGSSSEEELASYFHNKLIRRQQVIYSGKFFSYLTVYGSYILEA